MNVFTEFRRAIMAAVQRLSEQGVLAGELPLSAITVEPPRDPSHGDLATNVAMVLGKPAKMAPRALAEQIKPLLEAHEAVEAVEIAGPGFINLRLNTAYWQRQVGVILKAGTAYGDSDLGAGEPVNVEYVSANPTGPMHVGHCRGAVFGDALAALLAKAGYQVAREYYINDAGAQVDVLARSTHLRYREALGETIEIPEGLYPGDYLKPVGEALAKKYGDKFKTAPEQEWLQLFRQEATDAMMAVIREDLAALNIHHEIFTSEKALHDSGAVQHAFDRLKQRGLIYTGVLEPPKGKVPDDYEPRPQELFKASEFGDDTDRPLKKSDGSWTYFGADIAYHDDKYRRGFKKMIDVWGADHGGYVKRMKAAVKAISNGEADLDVKLVQMVNLLDGGQPVKMSKRAGTFVTLRDVVDEVGKDVVRFIMLTRKNDAQLDFDFKKVTEQSKDNPVFYVQYAHARICSVLRNAAGEVPQIDTGDGALAQADMSLLNHPSELALIKLLANWPRLVESAAEAHEPHRVAFYLQDVAAAFHGLWNVGRDDTSVRFLLPDDLNLTRARLAMLRAVALVIASGLSVMGVTPVEEMR
ncbi:arginine--tRNA ligase [uncultured Ferrovibrio sp.]|jgi:arginyl-tRNA synthetase|uniref:arginine--tRNA ligase n=1 Tax=uncultured Ferrovibrio sp. TaxID=1576913 RepID=UPI00262D3EB1|nr:arginine--tRNA ligase [uncultured Ferrovibrio sp.]